MPAVARRRVSRLLRSLVSWIVMWCPAVAVVMDATWVLAASGDACRETILPEVEALKSRPPLNARDTGKGGSYLPDFWNGNWRCLRVRLLADANHRVRLYGRYQNLRACFLWCC